MAGAEIRLEWLRQRFKAVLGVVLGQVMMVPVLMMLMIMAAEAVFPMVQAAVQAGVALPLVGLLLGTLALANSPMVVVSVIKEQRAKGALAEVSMGASVCKDVLVLLLFTVLVGLIGNGDGGLRTVAVTSGVTLVHIALSIGVGVPMGWALAWLTERTDWRLGWLLVGLALLVSLLEPTLHIEPLFCLLAAGFTAENVHRGRTDRGTHRLERALNQVATPVFVMFFVAAGLGLHLDVLIDSWLAVVLFAGTRLMVLVVSVYLGARLGGADPRVRQLGWAAMVPQAGVTLGLAVIVAERFTDWGPGIADLIIACIALHELIGPIVFTWALKHAGESQAHLEEEGAQ